MQPEYQQLLSKNNYAELTRVCQDQIVQDSKFAANYWYLSLGLLLQDKEADAESEFLLGISNSNLEKEIYLEEFYQVFNQEALRQEQLKNYESAWDIRQFIRKHLPLRFDNLVQIVYVSLPLKIITIDLLQELHISESLALYPQNADLDYILQLFQNVIYAPLPIERTLDFLSSLLPHVPNIDDCIGVLLYVAAQNELSLALKILDICQKYNPKSLNNIFIAATKINVLSSEGQYIKALELARTLLLSVQSPLDKVLANQILLSSLMWTGGNWQEAEVVFQQHLAFLADLVSQNYRNVAIAYLSYISLACFFATYFQDSPRANHTLQHEVLSMFQSNYEQINLAAAYAFKENHLIRKSQRKDKKKIRIGYLSTNLRMHSIGWLARSLFQYHDRENFEIYGYFPGYKIGEDFLQEWFVRQVDKAFREGVDYWGDPLLIAKQIHIDEIDILIDLESITTAVCSFVIALKPAPIQVTWLGWDASNMPAIDYYIADNLVLPENAQEYYSEKIWRLPATYIATDGFEAIIPTISREQLNIPVDAVVYFSSQTAYKRHPDTVRAQLQIIKQVSNSYFLIKGLGDERAIQTYFNEMAKSEGVDIDRLRFLSRTNNSQEHRANIAIADVVLDTYPYNGATTTMETLWMGVPMVTRVGEQFVARNSYTMMMNAGITEGIAWSGEEYVEWGIRFGTEPDLRRDVAWKLRQSRKTSPLWNGKQFAKEMEKAYTQMWDVYLS